MSAAPQDVSEPAVSVIVPCFQQAQFLTEAVESVVGQTFSDWEVVIVDDGSPDATEQVANALIERHGDRIRLLRQANGGVARARNAGIAAARGKYILPLDADDKLHPDMLAETVRLLDRDDTVAIAYTDYEFFGASTRRVQVPEFDFDGLCRGNHITATALFRREAWEAAGGYNPNMVSGHEDWDLWIGSAERGYLPCRVPRSLFSYRSRPDGRGAMTARQRAEMAAQIMRNHPASYTARLRMRRFVVRIPRNIARRLRRLASWLSRGQFGSAPERW
jgi:glycosyltransferase involved in cell wall biosynthesis